MKSLGKYSKRWPYCQMIDSPNGHRDKSCCVMIKLMSVTFQSERKQCFITRLRYLVFTFVEFLYKIKP